MQEMLVKGDIITLKAGMKVYANIPERFVYSNRPLSIGVTKTDIEVDKTYNTVGNLGACRKGLIQVIKEEVKSHLGYDVNLLTVTEFVAKLMENFPEITDFVFQSGDFVVIDVKYDGGGTAMFHDSYPDGHHVFCKRLKDGKYDPEGQEADFYQSGGFTAMILPYDITAKGRFVQKFE